MLTSLQPTDFDIQKVTKETVARYFSEAGIETDVSNPDQIDADAIKIFAWVVSLCQYLGMWVYCSLDELIEHYHRSRKANGLPSKEPDESSIAAIKKRLAKLTTVGLLEEGSEGYKVTPRAAELLWKAIRDNEK